jgi:hypothetical protein
MDWALSSRSRGGGARSLMHIVGVAACLSACTSAQRRPIERTAEPSADASIELARVVGSKLRTERGPFVVYPTFLDRKAEPPRLDPPASTMATRLLEALREGAHTTYADTVAFKDANRRASLADSARYYFTLTAVPLIRGDTAYVDVFGGVAMKTDGPIEQDVMRYWFARRAGGWQFVRRQLLYAT